MVAAVDLDFIVSFVVVGIVVVIVNNIIVVRALPVQHPCHLLLLSFPLLFLCLSLKSLLVCFSSSPSSGHASARPM